MIVKHDASETTTQGDVIIFQINNIYMYVYVPSPASALDILYPSLGHTRGECDLLSSEPDSYLPTLLSLSTFLIVILIMYVHTYIGGTAHHQPYPSTPLSLFSLPSFQ